RPSCSTLFRSHLDGHDSVPAVGAVVHTAEGVTSALDVARHQLSDDLGGGGAAGRHVPHLFVVVPGADDGLGEDRRVGGDPGDGVLFDAPGQLTAVQHPAGYLIGPGGDAGQTEAVEVGKAHTSTLPGCGARPGAK